MLHSDKYIQALINEQPFFEIHQENVLGVQMDVFKNRPKSLVDFIESSAAHGDKPYLIFKDQVITFNQHLTLVKKAANILQTKYEVQQGDRVIDSHEGVEESAVIGIPHDDLGEEVMAIVYAKKSDVDDLELSAWVAKDLADFKVPSKWKFVNSPLPRNASGKLMKHVLIDTSKNTMVEENE